TNGIEVGSLEIDPPTLRSLGFSLPIASGDENYNAVAEVEYRKQSTSDWRTGLPLLRIRPEMADFPRDESFAGSIFGLDEDATYEVRITISDPDGGNATRMATVRTRPIPTANPVNPYLVNVSNSAELSAALSNAVPGHVITLAPGTYVGDFLIRKPNNGTRENPIFIRGTNRGSVIIKGKFEFSFGILSDYVTLEDVTLDAGLSKTALRIFDNEWAVIRRNRIINADNGILGTGGANRNYTIYDNVLEGNNLWPTIDKSTWNDEGIAVTGQGHAIFHNTLSGFGDALSLKRRTSIPNRAIDFYQNDVLWTGDDGLELDDGERNVRAWENRVTNSAVLISIQHNVDTGGPIYAFRNVGINQARRPFKLNDGPSGFYLFHNTSISTRGIGDWLWSQYNNGPIENFQIKNNMIVSISPDTTRAVTFQAPTKLAEFDYNGYHPDGAFWLGPAGDYQRFSGTIYDRNGRILTEPILETSISLGTDYTTFSRPQNVALHPSSNAVDAGTVIPNINDGYNGSAPDLGAWERGLGIPHYGALFPNARKAGEVAQDDNKVIRRDRLTLHLDSQRAFWNDILVSLTPLEFKLILLMSNRPNEVLSDEEISALIVAEDPDIDLKDDFRNVILSLRRKFRSVDSSFAGIEFYPGRGFAWRG
ncbi:MAG: chondroitinase-B domain-containing protein, partial [Paracoccaceae bacterium]